MLKDTDNNWVRWEESTTTYFYVKFSASNHNFSSEKFYYKDGLGNDSTREVYNFNNNTVYTIKDAQIIEGIVAGESHISALHSNRNSVPRWKAHCISTARTKPLKLS